MKKIVFFYDVGFAGSQTAEVIEFDDNVTDEDLDQYAWESALGWAESYGVYPESDRELSGELDEEFDECYSHNIEGYWEVYDPAKHDALI
jgi:hypothetical protein